MITKFCLDLTSDIAGLVGGVLLVKPAWKVNRLAKQRQKIDQILLTGTDPLSIRNLREEVSSKIGAQITAWERSDELAVLAGILLVIFSFGIKIVWALVVGPDTVH